MPCLLSMQNIDKLYYPIKALDRVHFEVAPGEIHALIGANGAGKSTLMKILCGEATADNGTITFDGQVIDTRTPDAAKNAGIVLIHQELSTIHSLTVAQYLFVGREPMKGIVIDDRKMESDAAALLAQVGADFSPSNQMGDLSIAEQQMVEIAKALSFRVKLLILDEPTTALGDRETETVFKIVRGLKAQGVSVVYISHRLEELFVISDRITVLRDGKYITTLTTADTTKEDLIRLLAGHDLKVGQKNATAVPPDAPTVLEVRNLCTSSLLKNVSFSLKKGEILGLAGLMGSGRTETAKAICGIDPKTDGQIFINGREVSIRSPKDAAKQGICYLSEDRNGEGLIPARSIIGNTVISSLKRYRRGAALDDRQMLADTVDYNARLNTKYADPHAPISSLSGGNAQKVVIARWLLRDCPIFIFDEPTKGIDVGAKDEIYQIISDIVQNGHSVILISSETDELLRNCDRLVVLSDGCVAGELPIEEASQERILACAANADTIRTQPEQ